MRHSLHYVIALLLTSGYLTAAEIPPAGEEPVRKHLNAIKKLESLTCDVAFYQTEPEDKASPKPRWNVRYYRHQDMVRAIFREDGKNHDHLYKSGTLSAIRSDDSANKRVQTKSARKTSYSNVHDAYTEMLFAINIPATLDYAPLDELIGKAVTSEFRDTEPEVPHLLLTFKRDDTSSRLDIQFSNRHNYLIDTITYVINSPRGATTRVYHVQNFQEMSPGLFVPTLITLKLDFDGKLQGEYKTVVSNILCNRHDPRNFVQQLSNNMLVADAISKTAYKIDANGRKSSVDKPLKSHPPRSVPSGAHTGDTVAESARPQTGWVNAWTITSLVVLIGASIVIYYRRKR